MDFNKQHSVFFIGIGGIGMSALARYFNVQKMPVAGYDRTATTLTDDLQSEGIFVTFEDNPESLDSKFRNPETTMVVYTPAVPESNRILEFYRRNGFTLLKRAEMLGLISKNHKTLAVAGTHGKTTTSTMVAHLLHNSLIKTNAFLGGIAKNYNTNLLLSDQSEYAVVEADEYDRSFLHLHPYAAIVTTLDADHLDIYGNFGAVKQAFRQFVAQVQPDGYLIINKSIAKHFRTGKRVNLFTYSFEDSRADFYAQNVRYEDGYYRFDLITPVKERIEDIVLGLPGQINVENAVAASALAYLVGLTSLEIKQALKSFAGIKRRFDIQHFGEARIYIDDYAHHPSEIRALIKSVKDMFPTRKVLGIFQPHLFTRTRDFAEGFAKALSELDQLILLDIYPAREQPIPGVSSKIIGDLVDLKNKQICRKEQLVNCLLDSECTVWITMGAGDIDKLVPKITEIVKQV